MSEYILARLMVIIFHTDISQNSIYPGLPQKAGDRRSWNVLLLICLDRATRGLAL
jgi:hypothetical protein